MKKTVIFTSCIIGVLLLSACAGSGVAQNDGALPPASDTNGAPPPIGGSGSVRQRQSLTLQDQQQYLDEANAAPDKTTLTKDEFTAELQTLMQAQRATFQRQQSGSQLPSGNFPRMGSGSRLRGQGLSSGSGALNRLANATTFLKYTDPSGAEALLALDADGNVLMKWPRAFAVRRGGPPATGSSSSQ
jgi:hypothetical protein